MFALPGILALVTFIYIRPQEFLVSLRAVPLLYLFFALAAFGYAVDLKLRLSRPARTPHLPWVILFFVWCMLTLVVRAPELVQGYAVNLAIPIALYLLISSTVQTFKAFQLVCAAILGCVIFVSALGVQQGLAPFGCFAIDWKTNGEEGKYDGRPCVRPRDCETEDAEPGADYMCEHVGAFDTSSIGGGRVRYRGVLQDPNFLSLAVGIGLPFAFCFYERRRNAARALLMIGTLALVGTCAVFTQSRGGQLVMLTVIAAYFVRQYGMKGLALGMLVALPILLLGGRSGEEAESSSLERLGCWYEGMSMFLQWPILGVGQGLFGDHYFLTAHNSYVLAPAELGFPGMVIWSSVMYITTKIPIQALRAGRSGRWAEHPEAARVARTWGMAMMAAIFGLLVGIFFLSFCYHNILWIYVGLSGALYTAIRTHDPEWEVTFRMPDFGAVVAIDIALVTVLFVYTRIKGSP